MERGRLKNLPFFGSGDLDYGCVKFLTSARAFRLTKSKFQILSIIQVFLFPNLSNFSISSFFLFLQILPFSLILVSSAGGGVFSKMIVRHTKILLLFQILAVVFSWDWSWEFDRSWSGPYQKF